MHDSVVDAFEESRPRLQAVAYRMLGSSAEAEDAVQEAWLRLSRSESSSIDNLGGWLTTVVARICLDMLRARRPAEAVDAGFDENRPAAAPDQPDEVTLLADSIGPALMVVLDTLGPAERLAFVLHDLFDVPFDEVAPIVDRSPAAARQLASRARRRVRGMAGAAETSTAGREAGHRRQREVVDAFLAASREGDFKTLLAVLDPEVVLRADPAAVHAAARRAVHGAPRLRDEIHGVDAVAQAFAGGAAAAQPATIDGSAGAAWAPSGRPRAVFRFTTREGRIVRIEIIADPKHLRELTVTL
jgi:RNA polymerase sigma-70 factor (ECF subfamily)